MIVPVDGDFRLASEAHTRRLGAAVAGALGKGEAVCLNGPLGAGKSVLARALIRTLTSQDLHIPSPTFTLMQPYDGPSFPIAHFDLYRLTSAEEAYEIGLDEALREGAVVIEWAERLGHHLPLDRLDIDIAVDDENAESRRVRLAAHGAWEGRAIAL